jgi:hypothetical protein
MIARQREVGMALDENRDASARDESWEIVKTVEDVEEATLAAGFLQSNGVEAEVESLYASEFPANLGRLGEVRIRVPAGQAAEARALLEQQDAAPPPATEAGEPR